MKILLIDDNEAITKATARVLKLKGHDCNLVNDGKTGLNLITENEYDLILLDMSMPGFSGLDLLKSLKADSKNFSKIVICTAMSVPPEQLAELKNFGIKSILKKPFSLSEIDKIISDQDSSLKISNWYEFENFNCRRQWKYF